MSWKAEFCLVMVLVILPFLVVSMLSDITKRGFFCLLAAISTVVLIYGIHLTTLGQAVGNFFDRGGLASYLLLSILFAVLSASVALWLFVRRSNFRSLKWPKNISVRQMEQHGIAHLKRHGWTVSDEGSLSGSHVFRCKKDQLRLVVVFVVGQFNLETFCNEIRFRRFDLHTVVIACKQMPSENAIKVARARGPTIIRYDALLHVDQIGQDLYADFI